MAIYRLQCSLLDESNMARDQYVSSFFVDSASGSTANYNAWSAAIGAFYVSLKSYLSPVVAQGLHTVKTYDIALPLESPPINVAGFEMSPPPSGSALPNEVAVCLSYKGVQHAGWNLQSTRGRIYVGPLNQTTMGVETPNQRSRVSSDFVSALLASGTALANGLRAGTSSWGVYSRLHQAITPIVELSVDNEWDTMRTRGLRATGRQKVTLTPPP